MSSETGGVKTIALGGSTINKISVSKAQLEAYLALSKTQREELYESESQSLIAAFVRMDMFAQLLGTSDIATTKGVESALIWQRLLNERGQILSKRSRDHTIIAGWNLKMAYFYRGIEDDILIYGDSFNSPFKATLSVIGEVSNSIYDVNKRLYGLHRVSLGDTDIKALNLTRAVLRSNFHHIRSNKLVPLPEALVHKLLR